MTREKEVEVVSRAGRNIRARTHDMYLAYRRHLKAGKDVSLRHEELVTLLDDVYGPTVSEYFDRKRTLPYVTKSWLPWPVSPISFEIIYALRILIGLAVGGVLFYFTRGIGPVSLLIGVIGCAVVYFIVFPILGMLPFVAPKDLEQREKAVREYADLVQAHESMKEEAARRARDERLGGERF